MKDTARLYKTTPSLNIISALNEMIETGKNATVLLTLANNMKENKQLPKWAKAAFSVEHFEKLFALKITAFRKVVKDDSYNFLRTVINIELKGSVITEDQALKLKQLLTIQTFANNEFLTKILATYENSLNSESNDNESIIDNPIEAPTQNTVKTEKSEVFLLGEKIKALGLDDAVALRQLLDQHIEALTAENAENEKVA